MMSMLTRRHLLATIAAPALAQRTPQSYPTIGKLVREDVRFDALVDPNAKIEVLGSGFAWSEGPLWIKDGGYLIFSDIPRNQVMKWDPKGVVSVWLKPAGYTGPDEYGREPGSNGLVLDPEGRVVLCEHGDRRISVLTKQGGKVTLADRYQGKRLNSPNDGCFHSSGAFYFTDPIYGLPQQEKDPRRELDFCGVFRVKPDGTVTLLTKEMSRPNGIAFSPDEKTLYVANSDGARAIWMAYPVKDDGTLAAGRVLADVTPMMKTLLGAPDGLKVDRAGNVWATGPGGVHVMTPEGKRLGRIDPGERTANCAWGDDGSTLYLTSDMYLCRIRTKTKGAGW